MRSRRRCVAAGGRRGGGLQLPFRFGPPHAAPGRRRVYPLGSARANYLWFVSAERVERGHPFERGESRALTAAELARQLSAAGYLGTQIRLDVARANSVRGAREDAPRNV
jgi:hypothetical protein